MINASVLLQACALVKMKAHTLPSAAAIIQATSVEGGHSAMQ
jgi:hypothetical protein